MFLEAIMWWFWIGLGIITFGVLIEINEFLKKKDPEDKQLKKVLGNKMYNFLDKNL